jgi:hypothetical protein
MKLTTFDLFKYFLKLRTLKNNEVNNVKASDIFNTFPDAEKIHCHIKAVFIFLSNVYHWVFDIVF